MDLVLLISLNHRQGGGGSKIPKNWPDIIHGWFLATVAAHQLIELLKSL